MPKASTGKKQRQDWNRQLIYVVCHMSVEILRRKTRNWPKNSIFDHAQSCQAGSTAASRNEAEPTTTNDAAPQANKAIEQKMDVLLAQMDLLNEMFQQMREYLDI
uniref:Uncharacterized protein n=1 Tax=Romanomermis culicivorax TaxID=13658 RepID=A0A915HYA6_ROMCU